MNKFCPVIITSKLPETRAHSVDLMEFGVTFDNHNNVLQLQVGSTDGPQLPFANSTL